MKRVSIFIALIFGFSGCATCERSLLWTEKTDVAVESLTRSMREKRKEELAEKKQQEKNQEALNNSMVQEFLKNDPVDVKALGIKARPVGEYNAVKASILNYQKNGKVEPIIVGNKILFPYSLSQPELVCVPLRTCHIELEAGERVMDLNPGDTQRWWIGVSHIGDGETFKQHVIVKPLVTEKMETTIAISTNRRFYYIVLKSVPEGEYTPYIGFFYPQEHSIKVDLPELSTETQSNRPDKDHYSRIYMFDDYNFYYEVKGKKRQPWWPDRIYDDGKKVFIQFPKIVDSYELPVFFVVGNDNEYEIVNYRTKRAENGNLVFEIDRLFDKGVLVLRTKKSKEIISVVKGGKR